MRLGVLKLMIFVRKYNKMSDRQLIINQPISGFHCRTVSNPFAEK